MGSEAQAKRVEIPGLCWVRKPDAEHRCCRPAGHDGEHHHYYGGGVWPRKPGDSQAD